MKKTLFLFAFVLSQILMAQEETQITDPLPEVEVSSVEAKLNAIGVGGGIDFGTTALSAFISRQLSDRHALDLHVGKTSKKNVKGAEEIMDTESTSIALSDRMRLTDNESFYVRAGIYREVMSINNKTNSRVLLEGQDIGAKTDVTTIGASVSIGNRFLYENGFFGVDWIGLNAPLNVDNEFESLDKSDLRLLNVYGAITF